MVNIRQIETVGRSGLDGLADPFRCNAAAATAEPFFIPGKITPAPALLFFDSLPSAKKHFFSFSA